jgi:hypothetical protein
MFSEGPRIVIVEDIIWVGEGGEYLWSSVDCVGGWVRGLEMGHVRWYFTVQRSPVSSGSRVIWWDAVPVLPVLCSHCH